MAIINRFHIRRYKEVFTDILPGTIDDGAFSTFNLDDPTINNIGTSDFVGTIKRSILLGEVYKDVLDTNPKKLRVDPLPIVRYQQLTEAEYNTLIQSGEIIENPRTNGRSELIGWVELGKSYPSFYYQDCTINGIPGKQPRSDNYFDFQEITLSLYKVSGNGTGQQALQQVGNWNINETYGNWGTTKPFEPLLFEDYIRASIGGPGVYDYPFTTNQRISQIPLLIADKLENFDGNNTIILSPSFSDPLSSAPTTQKTVYGRIRRSIPDGFKPFELKTNVGDCLPLNVTVVRPSSGDEEIEEDVLVRWDVSNSGGGANEDGTYDYETLSEEEEADQPTVDVPYCNDESIIKVRYPEFDKIETGSYVMFSVAKSGNLKNYNEKPETSGELDQFAYYIKDKEILRDMGVIDPRESLSEISNVPRGVLQFIKNKETCTLDVYPNFRDKDGDVAELVGPELSKYIEVMRASLMDRFFVKSPILTTIGNSSDGLYRYSDGNSYLELHGESIFGCGKRFALSDIPEIFTEMYSTSEKLNVERYRFIIERGTQYQNLVLNLSSALGVDTTKTIVNSYKKQLINDVVDDIIFGIPDMDFAEVGSDPRWTDILAGAGFGVLNAFIKYYFSGIEDEKNRISPQKVLEILKAAFAGYLGGLSFSEIFKQEEDLYRDIAPSDFSNLISFFETRSREKSSLTFYSYRFFDDFWSRDGLSNVYLPNNGVNILEEINGGILTVKTDKKTIGSLITDSESAWYESDRTVEDLKKLQSGFALPSRWKSIMRPIYQDLWYDQDGITAERVATTPYLGQHITALELGDYETHRKKFGMKKNLYDEIDDVISVRIVDKEILASAQSSKDDTGFFKSMIDDSSRILDSFLDPLFDTLTQEATTLRLYDIYMKVNELFKKNGRDWSRLRTYIELINDGLQLYGVVDNIDDLKEAIREIQQKFSLNNPSLNQTQLREETKKIWTRLGNRLLEKMFDSVNDFIINTGLDYIDRSLQVTQESRTFLSPRRVMKPGSVVLRSKSGYYSTDKQPCPIIFLGFNDSGIMSTFSNLIPNGLECLTGLSKTNEISTVYCSTTSFLNERRVSNPLIMDDIAQKNLGNIEINSNTLGPQYVTYTRTDQIPVINKRIRQYGRNPFLDIFYLNILPDSSYVSENQQDIKKAALDSKMHLSPSPRPFRYPTIKNVRFSKVMNSNIPSIFPPWWNEPAVIENFANAKFQYDFSLGSNFWKEHKNWNHGDVHFLNRKPNNILKAKDRWSMKLERIGEYRYAILEDKTYILDIYFGLLNLHVLGVEWDKLLPLIKDTKNAVNIVYDSNGEPDEKLSKIDTNALTLIWTRIRVMLGIDSPISIVGNTTWKSIAKLKEPIPITTTVSIENNTDYDAVLTWEDIEIISNNGTDRFGQKSNNLFYIGNAKPDIIYPRLIVEETENKILPPPSWWTNSPSDWLKMRAWQAKNTDFVGVKDEPYRKIIPPRGSTQLDVHFIPYGIQPNHQYISVLKIPIKVKSKDGLGEYIFNATKTLSAEHGRTNYTLSEKNKFIYDLRLMPMDFDILNDPDQEEAREIKRIYLAHNIQEDVYFKSLRIENESIIDSSGTNITNEIYSNTEVISLFKFKTNESKINEDISDISFYDKMVGPGGIGRDEFFDTKIEVELDRDSLKSKFGNSFRVNCIYHADLVLDYMLAPRLNYDSFVEKQERCKIFFISYV